MLLQNIPFACKILFRSFAESMLAVEDADDSVLNKLSLPCTVIIRHMDKRNQ